jgi:hypothetical protein
MLNPSPAARLRRRVDFAHRVEKAAGLRRVTPRGALTPHDPLGPRVTQVESGVQVKSGRWYRVLLVLGAAVLGVLLCGSVPAMASVRAPHAPVATHPAATANPHTATTNPHTATQVTPATLTDRVTPDLPDGVCQVPGIGDIGSVVGLCAAGSSGVIGDLNNICEPALPQPEPATGGIDAMIQPPDSPAGGKTLYDNYGVSGQFWAAHDMQCSDMTSLVGNNVAGMVFDAAKAMDRVTITVYQSAAGNNILTWLSDAVNTLISALGKAIYFPYLAPVVILGAIWLAWQGLVRKRATRAIEGTLWMVIAATAAICLIGKPAAFTGVGTSVSNGVTSVLNTAFAKLPNAGNSNCLPVTAGDPESVTTSYSFTSGNGMVDENANELWSVLVCKPWLYGEFGTTAYAAPGSNSGQTLVNQYGRALLYSQAIAANQADTTAQIAADQSTYTGIANALKANDPGVYSLFQGDQWTTRLEIAFAAMFAAVVAGSLILLVSLTLIVLKIGFLLLLVAGPFFLIIGTHPGFGRIIAIRWFEMIVGVLMKQVAIAITLSVLLYCYSLIMGTSDQTLPWALKILMIALVTVTVFIYRKPFQHLFSAVGYGTIGSQERADYYLREAGATARGATLAAIPGIQAMRVARWARRNPVQAATTAAGAAAGGPAGVAAGAATVADVATGGGDQAGGAGGGAGGAAEGDGGGARRLAGTISGGSARARALAEAEQGNGRAAPPLDLPSRSGTNGTSGASAWSRGAGRSNGGRPNGVAGGGGGSAPPLRGRPGGNGSGGTSGGTSGGGAVGGGTSGGRASRSGGSAGSGSGGSNGGTSGGNGARPTWPASGWSGVRQRPRSRQDPPPPPAGE